MQRRELLASAAALTAAGVLPASAGAVPRAFPLEGVVPSAGILIETTLAKKAQTLEYIRNHPVLARGWNVVGDNGKTVYIHNLHYEGIQQLAEQEGRIIRHLWWPEGQKFLRDAWQENLTPTYFKVVSLGYCMTTADDRFCNLLTYGRNPGVIDWEIL